MWIAISDRGMSKPYSILSKPVAVNTDISIKECLQPKLLPFIHKHHRDVNYLFWPELAGDSGMDGGKIALRRTLQMSLKLGRLRTCGVFWHRMFIREDGRPVHSNSWLTASICTMIYAWPVMWSQRLFLIRVQTFTLPFFYLLSISPISQRFHFNMVHNRFFITPFTLFVHAAEITFA